MEKDSIQAYSKRITQANRTELVVITYEIIIEHVENAKKYYENRKEFVNSLEKAQSFLKELMVSLDFNYEISSNLLSLYIFINKQLIEAKQKNTCEMLSRIQGMLESLLSSFKQVSEQDKSAPLMQNTQKVYAGLTYGKEDINEMSVMADSKNRGFRA
ncbi:flagellar export chaperone FliS [[Clostridium] polysaccharolyticum]|uniref:Flagellar protein FliS n=1 Tax=[Clostridium] polysaccharolyticum TaxID=29364 RepID=A0A1I0D8I1_9FIRM|nr:flagellar protein FliS [[Clostridium] polysaccharolyticum]SET28583.1 flagellar protein FliS [[Clostridium] polysaccharolyticum]